MTLDLTNYPTNGDDIPDDWKWWECSSCGDYAYIAPDCDIPNCSCSEFKTIEPEITDKKDKVIAITKREYEILIKQCFSDISVKAAEAREHGISYQLDSLIDIVAIIKRAQELGIRAKEASRD
jgi:hypothetical protein